MWFKNLQLYRFPAPWKITPAQLEEQLARHPFRGATGYEMQASGWAPPRDTGALVYAVNGQMLIALGTEKKLLPASVIREEIKIRAQKAEALQGYKPGRKQLRDIKIQVTDTLLPRAFNVRRNTFAWIDIANGWLVIDAGSPGKADEVVSLLNKSLVDLRLARLDVEKAPGTAMTGWLAADDAPRGFTIDDDTELQSPVEEKATVRFVRHALDPKEVKHHINAGKQCTRLALTWANRVSFVLTDALAIKKLAAVDIVRENTEGMSQNADEQFDADFTLMTGELHGMIDDLVEALGGFLEK